MAGCPKEILFVNYQKGVKAKRGSYGKAAKSSTIAVVFMGEKMVSGMGSAQMLVWQGPSCTQVVNVH